jgi:transposase-like protein
MTQKRTVRKFTAEFREEAVALVTQQGYSVSETAKTLGIIILTKALWGRCELDLIL